jgi:hypothetical protein
VASNGLIEKVRTNLLLQSNTFSSTWTVSNASVTSGQAGYDGSSNAWLLENNSGTFTTSRLWQGLSQSSSLYTFSVYAKAGTTDIMRINVFDGATTRQSWFNFTSATFSNTSGLVSTFSESLGSGWYRISVVAQSAITQINIYPSAAAGSSFADAGDNILIQDAQLEVGDIATAYIATTTTAVSVGPVSGLPRLDYLNSSCPRLLLEPQRTNLITYSEQFNTSWLAVQSSITANQTISPSGYQDADLIVETTANTPHHVNNSAGISSTAGVHTASVFFKKNTKNFGFIQIATDGAANRYTAVFDLVNGTATSTTTVGSPTSTSNSIVDYGNGWYRVSVSAQHTSGLLYVVIGLSNSATPTYNATGYPTYIGNGTDSIAMWGAQLELGAYATSYIPTLSTSVTRVADAASKTGISSLIGQTEGTLFVEAKVTLNGRLLLIGAAGNFIEILANSAGKVNGFVRTSVTEADILSTSTYATGDTLKVAFAYKQNDFALYVNGTAQGTDTSGNVPTGMAQLIVNDYLSAGFNSANVYSQALLFKTRLTNESLASLTSL